MRRRRLIVLLVLLAACKRPSAGSSPAPSASLASPAPSASAPPAPPPLRLDRPFAGALRGSTTIIAGIARGQGNVVVAEVASGRPPALLPVPAPSAERISDVDVVATRGGLAVTIETPRGSRALRGTSPEKLGGTWEPIDVATCATGDATFSLGRSDGGLAIVKRPFDGSSETTTAWNASGTSLLLCGDAAAFVIVDDGAKRLARRADAAGPEVAMVDGRQTDDSSISFHPAGGRLLALRVGERSGVSFREWDGTSPTPTRWRGSTRLPPESSIDLVVVGEDVVGLVVTRAIAAARRCPSDEADSVAELWTFDRATGESLRGATRLDRWSCGADPGPFFGGSIGPKVVVAWPRGADSACAKLGVRWGGVAYVVATKDASSPVQTIDAPNDAIEDLGCDDRAARCGVAVLSRAKGGTCFPADAPDAGEPRVILFP